ncbi:DUF6773 family protein [Microbacteriaceae bacterium 4G12]
MLLKREIMDERLEAERNKMLALVAAIFTLGILFDIAYKALYVKLPLQSYIGEIIIWFVAAGIYTLIGTKKGLLFLVTNKKEEHTFKFKALLSGIAFATFALVTDFFDGTGLVLIKHNVWLTILAFIGVVLVSWCIDLLLMKLSNKNAEKDE